MGDAMVTMEKAVIEMEKELEMYVVFVSSSEILSYIENGFCFSIRKQLMKQNSWN